MSTLITMSSCGFGICGHKNSYSTGVKLGNYVEDRFGAQMTKSGQSHPLSSGSEVTCNFIDPKEMPDKCANAPQEDLVERSIIRAGLPYNLIFEHGAGHIPTTKELSTKYTLSSRDIGRDVSFKTKLTSETSANQQREMKRAREARELRQPFVTAKQALIPATIPRK